MEILDKLKQLDAYPKINEDFYRRTLSGGVITMISSILIVMLFFTELRLFLHGNTENELLVDTSRGEMLQINFDVTFPTLACSILSVDAMDISGEQHLDVKHDVFKKRLDASGNAIETSSDKIGVNKIDKPLQRHGGGLEHNETYCGSCYGAEASDDHCCNSCEEVREAYRTKGWALTNPDMIDQCKREGFIKKIKEEAGEGCNIYGSLEVNKVAGNFHFAPGKSFQHSGMHVHDLMAFQTESFNVSHKIHKLTFGANFPGVVNPLDGYVGLVVIEGAPHLLFSVCRSTAYLETLLEVTMNTGSISFPSVIAYSVQWTQQMRTGMYQYFIKVVPTVYTDMKGHKILTNQFSVTEHFKASEFGQIASLPGVFFFYDLSPIKVTFREQRTSFLHFLTNISAIIGGIFTVSGIIDSFVYHGERAIRKKIEIGKHG